MAVSALPGQGVAQEASAVVEIATGWRSIRAPLVAELGGTSVDDSSWDEVRLQPLEYQLLVALIDADGAAVGTWDLYERAFEGSEHRSGEPVDGYTDAHKNRIWVTISSLRKKIDPADGGSHIHNVHGIGYRFRPEAG